MIQSEQMAWARRLKVKHLESFLVLDEAGTLTEAAARMHMTQSAMSHWLADLEELVGMPLVTRGRRIQLTPAGVLVKRLAISVLGDISRTHKELGAVAQGLTARLQIGSVWAGVAHIVPRALAEFQARYPHISVYVTESPFTNLLEGLANKELDVVVGSLDARAYRERLEHRELFEDNVCLVVGQGSPLWHSSEPMVRLADLQDENWIMPPKGTLTRTQLDALLLEQGFSWLLPKVETAAITTLQALVHTGNYIGVCSEAMARYQASLGCMKILPLDTAIRFGPVGVVWNTDNHSEAVRLFVEQLTECSRRTGVIR
ncbi:LysR family transcriptional regulator [Diaphorobacter ruginosibacter]|uniref:LysR family transcriptional regulator n=1 Tax=Diaphorobacter ruginosibacter TaxID=1715720 RepID=A0A7G9RJK8_9BURK|nr:LysR family transcriptional regulator [Diaphorobacter ruginosibacter]QNN55783.1 LysR family transcriptional regulator [Diaphorobacter ruginosibacter]